MGRAFEYRKARIFARNARLSKTFTRISKEITISVKASGPDPSVNSRLRMLLQKAKAECMPKDSVDRAIKKATDKDAADIKEIIYEGYGPGGVAILVVAATDNNTRTVSNVRSYLTKHGGTLGTSGSLSFLFEHKCVFKVAANDSVNLEDLELELIDFGVEEVYQDEETGDIIIEGAFESNSKIQSYLEENKLEIKDVEFIYQPNDYKEITPEQRETLNKLLDKMDEDDDVSIVFTNVKEEEE
ncbi:MAG: YebC/PmpR family DNA-binding transcriptional regulator [Paludibacteraceae bacterium]|nr:YebC/PmpR family DNA-binding transcriptional regulator [Paludibacteraceae bacterium]